MSRKPSGEIKTITVRQKQKNGDIYVIERQIQYDSEKKYNRVIASRLMHKIPKGSEIPVPTRPKRAKGYRSEEKVEIVAASRKHVGMMNIINHIGKVSGIDDAVYASTDTGTAQKIISLARYLLATNGQTLPGILTWQYNHPIPYAEGITEDVYHELFRRIGVDESMQQSFFKLRCDTLDEHDAIAYDSTTISTYSENQREARYGYNKAGDGLPTIKLLTLYSIEKRQPLVFTKQPGNLPDVITIKNAVNQLTALGVQTAEIVTDNGYYSEKNLAELLLAGYDFITLAASDLKWIRPELDKQAERLTSLQTACPFDPSTHGVSVAVMHEFKRARKYANHTTGESKGDEVTFRRRVYLHIYFNAARQVADQLEFEADLMELKALLEGGTPVETLEVSAQRKVKKYFTIRRWGEKVTVMPKDKDIRLAKKYHGFFVLVSNREKDPFDCLRKYRKRETIEAFFRSGKQNADSTRSRVWYSDTLRGRMFVQFIALCYYEYFADKVRKLKETLGQLTGDKGHDRKENIALELKLKSWLDNTPLYLQLQWFDTVENVDISVNLKRNRWNSETTMRDRLYLIKLGVTTE